MPIYHFHAADGRVLDPDGMECADEAVARRLAVSFAAEILQDEAAKIGEGGELHVELMDDAGRLLFTVLITAEEAARSH